MTRNAVVSVALLLGAAAAVAAFILVLGGVVPAWKRPLDLASLGPPEPMVEGAAFADLPGWAAGEQAGAIKALVRSCARFATLPDEALANPREALPPRFKGLSLAGQVRDWRAACAAAQDLAAAPDDAEASAEAREFFERHFTPVRILARRAPREGSRRLAPRIEKTGLVTGYFEPDYEAREAPDGRFSAPVLARPSDLVMVDLGEFRDSLAGERIAGSVADGRLVPYPDHAAIAEGALADKAEALAWLDPNDLFFLQVQGSGRLRFPDGRALRVGFAGQNGRPYAAIGRALIESGAIAREKISMQTIRAWLDAAPEADAKALRESNPSYVFFRVLDLADPALGPLGSEGAQLTAGRSLAVDPRYHAYGLPLWLVVKDRRELALAGASAEPAIRTAPARRNDDATDRAPAAGAGGAAVKDAEAGIGATAGRTAPDAIAGRMSAAPEASRGQENKAASGSVRAKALSRLYIAQDSGGAIKGPLRADIFFGSGAEAGEIAGPFRAEAEMFALLPRAVAAKLERPK